MTPEEVVGRRMRLAREEAKLSQPGLAKELSSLLGKTLQRQAVSAAEKGRRRFDPTEVMALAHVLKRPVWWFFLPFDEPVMFPSGVEIRPAKAARLVQPDAKGASFQEEVRARFTERLVAFGVEGKRLEASLAMLQEMLGRNEGGEE